MITAIVLAAGSSSRMGRTKQLIVVDGKPLVQHAIDAAAAADETILVLGRDAGRVAAAASLTPASMIVLNPDHAAGLSTSLAAGLAEADPSSDAAVILLADQPEVDRSAVGAVIGTYLSAPTPIVRARYGGVPAHPVLLAREVWKEASAAPEHAGGASDAGARRLIELRPDIVSFAEIDARPPRDIDTPDDLATLLGRRGTPGGESARAQER